MVKVHRQRVVVVRECLWKLTDEDFTTAAVLGQMIYWSLRTKDIDDFLKEEAERMQQSGEQPNVAPTYGWVYKKAEELAEELLEICSRRTVGRRLEELVESGWLERRRNPRHQWDRTWQYRPDLRAVDEGLQELGYSLEDALPERDWAVIREYASIGHGDHTNGHSDHSSGQSVHSNGQSVQSSGHTDQSNGQPDQSDGRGVQAIPETTAETKTKSKDREQAASSSNAVCSIHNEPMQRREKEGDVWYSHKLPNGQWCKGKPEDQPGNSKSAEEDRHRYLEWVQS